LSKGWKSASTSAKTSPANSVYSHETILLSTPGKREKLPRLNGIPEDVVALDRLEQTHFLVRALFPNQLSHAPLPTLLTNVLHVHCATGTFLLEAATELSEYTTFHGVSTVPGFPNLIRPPSTHFSLVDEYTSLPFPDRMHCWTLLRFALPHLGDRLDGVLNEMIRVTRTGGYLEIIDTDAWLVNGSENAECLSLWMREALQKFQVDLAVVADIPNMLRRKGCIEVKEYMKRVTTGDDNGVNRLAFMIWRDACKTLMQGYAWEEEEERQKKEKCLEEWENEVKEGKGGAWEIRVVTAKRP